MPYNQQSKNDLFSGMYIMFIIEVKHMVPLKQHMYQHLRSAKDWLTKAEEAFDKQHDIRGELDLMLAQAELQHVKEANRSCQWRFKYVVFRHGVALVLAMFMVVVLSGVYWWTARAEVVIPAPTVKQVNLSTQFVAPETVNAIPSIALQENNLPTQESSNQVMPLSSHKVQESSEPEKRRKVEQPIPIGQSEEPVAVSADEMRKLVRAAGKSLRGQ